jgi:hypothetical protein
VRTILPLLHAQERERLRVDVEAVVGARSEQRQQDDYYQSMLRLLIIFRANLGLCELCK